jgi:hypothetical protein
MFNWATEKSYKRVASIQYHFVHSLRFSPASSGAGSSPQAPNGPPAAHELVLTARPASVSGGPTAPAPDYRFNIEFTRWSRVEAILDFGA